MSKFWGTKIMARRRKNLGGFSWKRLTGVSRAKRQFSRATGIPWSKSGRQRKLGSAGCLVTLLFVAVLGMSPVFGQYILNTETGKVHLPTCRTIQEGNMVGRSIVGGGANFVPVATTEGYDPCGVCNPVGRTTATPLTVRPTPPTTVRPSPVPVLSPATRQENLSRPIGFGVPQQNQPTGNFPRPGATPATPIPRQNTPAPQPEKETPILQWGWVQVKRVIDGDTFDLENGTRVRLIGADTPETVHPTRPEEPFGKLASDFTKRCVERSDNWVFLVEDGDTVDRYGRQLAMVYFRLPTNDGEHTVHFLNEGLIRAGLATAQTQYRYSQKMKDLFIKAEREAREKKARIWSTAL